jgi:hypothetical protein
MIGRLLASAAFAVALTGTAPISMAKAQMAAPPPANPSASPSATDAGAATGAPTTFNSSQPSMGQRTMRNSGSTAPGLSSNRQTAQGHEQENGVADKLNACEAKPMSERQACFSAATRM